MAVAGGVSYRDPWQLSSRPAPNVVAARCCLGLADRHALFGGHAGVLLDGMKGGDPFKRLGRDRPILKATMAVPGPPRLEERTICHRRRRQAPEPPSPKIRRSYMAGKDCREARSATLGRSMNSNSSARRRLLTTFVHAEGQSQLRVERSVARGNKGFRRTLTELRG